MKYTDKNEKYSFDKLIELLDEMTKAVKDIKKDFKAMSDYFEKELEDIRMRIDEPF